MSLGGSVKKAIISTTVDKLISYLQVDPERRINRAVNAFFKFGNTFSFLPIFKSQIAGIKKITENDDHPGKNLIINLLKDTNSDVMHKLTRNFLVNGAWTGVPLQREITKKEGFNIPWFLLIDPTERCNYHCFGCWAGEYGRADMPFETFDRVLTEAKQLGVYFVVVSGGEPTLYPRLFEIFEKHNDMAFMLYTNGSIIDDKYAKKLAKYGNAVPCFSVEGFKEKTDERRGEGAWDRIMKAMDSLKKVGVPFGYSITETRNNIDEVLSDGFLDYMIDKGAKIAWYFQYIPTGRDPDVNLMITPEQRMKSYNRIHYIRSSKSLFVADFWNDGPYTGGCIAGGRRYLHITADGGIEPCAFIHLSQGNVNNISLKEVLQLPFFKEIQKMQPYTDNLLQPCMIVDNPDVFRKIGSLSDVKSTDGTLENMSGDVGKYLDDLSKRWEELSRPVFERDYPELAKKTREYKERKERIIKESGGDIEQFYVSDEFDK
jgi:MoaA/NifB/PqqE/SkfB family radical SAM enzyme